MLRRLRSAASPTFQPPRRLHGTRRKLGEHTGSAHGLGQHSGYGQRRVANHFAFEALAREVPKQLVARVDGRGGGIRYRRLLIGVRHHDQLVHLFDVPTALDKFRRQPVEQFRMRGTLTHQSEVAR